MVLAGGGKRGVRGLTQPLGSQTAESGELGALAVSCSERCPTSKDIQAGDLDGDVIQADVPSPARGVGQPAPSRGAETR